MQLPCVVIGAGLTAVDAATEAQAYYLQMVQMVHLRLDEGRRQHLFEELLGLRVCQQPMAARQRACVGPSADKLLQGHGGCEGCPPRPGPERHAI